MNNKKRGAQLPQDRRHCEKNQGSSDFQLSNLNGNESSYENSLCIKKEKKIKLKLRKERIYKKKNHGSWTCSEEKSFVNYMKQNREIFQSKQLRRSHRIFREMSKIVCTRSPEQCRSHHQKYENRFSTFHTIVDYIEAKILEEERIQALKTIRSLDKVKVQDLEPCNYDQEIEDPSDKKSLLCFKSNSEKQIANLKSEKDLQKTQPSNNFESLDKLQKGVQIFLNCQSFQFKLEIDCEQFFANFQR